MLDQTAIAAVAPAAATAEKLPVWLPVVSVWAGPNGPRGAATALATLSAPTIGATVQVAKLSPCDETASAGCSSGAREEAMLWTLPNRPPAEATLERIRDRPGPGSCGPEAQISRSAPPAATPSCGTKSRIETDGLVSVCGAPNGCPDAAWATAICPSIVVSL